MKRKRAERPERRRPLIEINLTGEARGRGAARRRGCLPFLSSSLRTLAASAGLLLMGLGLHRP